VYAAAELPFNIPRGPRQGDTATMLALREQRQAADPGIRVAQLPPGPVVRMEPIPDGSTFASTTLAPEPPRPMGGPMGGSVIAMAPVSSPGDFQRSMEPIVSPGDRQEVVGRMEPVVSAGDPGSLRAEPLVAPPPPAPSRPVALAAAPAPAPRGFSLIGQAQAGTLPPRVAAGPSGNWGIQVGAFASENLARAAAGQARDAVAQLGTRTAVEPTAQGRNTLFRARVTGLSSRTAAEQACDRLRGRGACMVVAPGA
jgi:hypothetical protein